MASKVLLVEDDNNLREIYEARLQAEGYNIVLAKDGEEALVVAKKEHPDLIISDVMMPRVSGFDMLDILRNTNELKNTKVIMLTALGQAEDRARADQLGADRYLVKSQVTLEDIVKASQDLITGNSGIPVTANPVGAPTVPLTPSPQVTPVVAATTPSPQPTLTSTPMTNQPVVPTTPVATTAITPPVVPAAAPSIVPAVPVTQLGDKPANPPAPPIPEPQATPVVADPPTVPEPVAPSPSPVVAAPVEAPEPAVSTPPVATTANTTPAAPTTSGPSVSNNASNDQLITEALRSLAASPPHETAPAANPPAPPIPEPQATPVVADPPTVPEPVAPSPSPVVAAPVEAPEPRPPFKPVIDEAEVVKKQIEEFEAGKPVEEAPSPPPEPAAETQSTPPEKAEDEVENDNVVVAHKKIIAPIDGPKVHVPDINELLAKEGAKTDSPPTADVATAAVMAPGSADPDTPPVATDDRVKEEHPPGHVISPGPDEQPANNQPAAPAKTVNGVDPNSIAL